MGHDLKLENAVRSLRETVPGETLSGETRDAIRRRVVEGGRTRSPLAALFPTSWRIAAAGALPLVLALTVIGLSGRGGDSPAPVAQEPVAYKIDGRVVFDVAGGATVTKSSVPFKFDERAAVKVEDGRYADSMRDGQRLVFYRIQ